jgi:GTPase Era involved in 16S rRNA processing
MSTRNIIVLGALGAGKSTVLNILNSKSNNSNKKVFISSNSLNGCTQEFDSDIAEIPELGRVFLSDSPGLADPRLPIDMWTNLYNKSIANKNIKFDLVICVIEHAERPSIKEFTLFALLNQAFNAMGVENLVIIFNKCPPEIDQIDALEFYNECCNNSKSKTEFPILKTERILVLERKAGIK